MRRHILILCTDNSARSVLAEAMLNHWAARLGRDVHAHSAGSAPSGKVNPLALEALERAGIDTRACRSKSWDEFGTAGAPPLALVITLCDGTAAQPWPVLFGGPAGEPARVHWAYADPAQAEGGEVGQRRAFELTRQALGYRMLQLLALPLETLTRADLPTALAEIGRS
jgi:arsenate reductase